MTSDKDFALLLSWWEGLPNHETSTVITALTRLHKEYQSDDNDTAFQILSTFQQMSNDLEGGLMVTVKTFPGSCNAGLMDYCDESYLTLSMSNNFSETFRPKTYWSYESILSFHLVRFY
jgi:hypothetical protein